MKVALIITNNIWFCPYVKIYSSILDDNHIPYDIISWNRDLSEPKNEFAWSFSPQMGAANRFIEYFKYSRFVRHLLENKHYDRIVLFGNALPVFLCFFLKRHYNKQYIIDFRDLGIEQKLIFKGFFAKSLKNSALNIVSSPGFLKYLPKGHFLISHNFNVSNVKSALKNRNVNIEIDEGIDILTIGGIRDYSSNIEVIKSLANKKDFKLRFVGKGGAAESLEQYVKEEKINNVSFSGYYKKENEPDIIRRATFLNIFYPKVKTHSSALSNRFYNALIMKKPMLVTSNSVQGDFVEKYQLGLSLDNCDNLDCKIKSFLKEFDRNAFEERCNILLEKFLQDYELFENSVLNFVEEK